MFLSGVCRSLAKSKTGALSSEEGRNQEDKGQANMELITKPGVCPSVCVYMCMCESIVCACVYVCICLYLCPCVCVCVLRMLWCVSM